MAISFVQQVGAGASVAGQTSLTTTATSFTATNLLIAIASWSTSVAAPTSINVPTGWTAGGVSLANGAPNGMSRVYYMPNNPGGSQSWTFTITPGSATIQGWAWSIYEFSGVATSTPLDLTEVQAATGASSSTTMNPGAATGTTTAGDLLIQLSGVDNSSALTYSASASSVPSTGWTVATTFKSTAGSPLAQTTGMYQILAGTQASPNSIMTASAKCSTENFFMTFKQGAVVTVQIPTSFTQLQAVNRASNF